MYARSWDINMDIQRHFMRKKQNSKAKTRLRQNIGIVNVYLVNTTYLLSLSLTLSVNKFDGICVAAITILIWTDHHDIGTIGITNVIALGILGALGDEQEGTDLRVSAKESLGVSFPIDAVKSNWFRSEDPDAMINLEPS